MLDVGGHRHLHGAGDAGDRFDHLARRDDAAVRMTERRGHARARGGDRGKAFGLEHARAGRVPGVGQHENRRAMVKGSRLRGFVGHSRAKYTDVSRALTRQSVADVKSPLASSACCGRESTRCHSERSAISGSTARRAARGQPGSAGRRR